jgi:hypothetical protein
MCFGSPKAPAAPVVPKADPIPQAIAPSAVEGQVSEDDRRKRLTRMRNGLASTIKSGAKGLTGSGPDLLSQTILGKNKLG